jgi:hypothetical protein
LLATSTPILAAGKKRQPPKPQLGLKRTIELDKIGDRYIEMPDPDEPVRYYGQNIYLELIDHLQHTHDYAVILNSGDVGPQLESAEMALSSNGAVEPDPCIVTAPPVSSSRISITLDELSFATGKRGERALYGFQRGRANPYNAGADASKRNEFPLRTDGNNPSWFERAFEDTGGLHSGLELGDEFNFDVLWVAASLKHQAYSASMGFDIRFDNRFGVSKRKQITAHGQGYYFDLSASYAYAGGDITAGIMVARKAAMLEAFNNVVRSAIEAIEVEVKALPLMTRLGANCAGAYYLSAGGDYRIPVGQRFYDHSQLQAGVNPTVFTVEAVYQRSARVSVTGQGFRLGDEVVSLNPGEAVPKPKPQVVGLASLSINGGGLNPASLPQVANINAGDVNLNVPAALLGLVESAIVRFWKGVKELVTLPYRIYRYFQYDQSYQGGELWAPDLKRALSLAQSSWGLQSIAATQAWQTCATCMGRKEVIVAVIDSGVDYNHRELRRSIYWDGVGDTPGWDFFSGDSRPYDDHAHGTEIASVIAGGGASIMGTAPGVTVLPIKAFSPFGITNSGALYAAFEYAIANGAKIIVIGWTTQKASKALEDAVKLADMNGVLVVAAAGDSGEDLGAHAFYPAAFSPELRHMIVVAGYDRNGQLTRRNGAFSNFGRGVDLAAPGADVYVARPRDNYAWRTHSGIAAGFTAGVAALAWSRCPKASADTIKKAVLDGANRLETLGAEVGENRALSALGALRKLSESCL